VPGLDLADRLPVFGFVEPEIDHAVALPPEMVGNGAHGGEKSRHLLDVMLDAVGLLPDLHDDIGHPGVRLPEPGVGGIELVAQDQTQGLFA